MPEFSLRNIDKRFGEVNANRNVTLDIHNNDVIALLGENGAGKSTLMKILYGVYTADAGDVLVDGMPLANHSPEQALRLGISMLFQQFNLVPALSVLENLLLAMPAAPWWQWRRKALTDKALATLRQIAPGVDPALKVRDLSVGEQQVVELAKIMALDARLIILDEPTAVLTPQEVERLYAFVGQCREAGKAVVLITHKLADVRAVATRTVVMRQGSIVGEWPTNAVSDNQLVQAMVGENAQLKADTTPAPSDRIIKLKVSQLSVNHSVGKLDGIDFELAKGEVLGVAGVLGNGQQALALALAGILVPEQGEVVLNGERISALAHTQLKVPDTIAYIPENPLQNAVAGELNLATNLQLRAIQKLPFLIWGTPGIQDAQHTLKAYDVRPVDPLKSAGTLSGGNLQKLVIARELSRDVELVIASYPTMGLDLIATRTVYERLFAQAKQGACVVWFSEDLDDLLQYAHRILVLYNGRIQCLDSAAAFDRRRLGQYMTGQLRESA